MCGGSRRDISADTRHRRAGIWDLMNRIQKNTFDGALAVQYAHDPFAVVL